ncbi:MAG: hypothetical protein ACR2QB_02925 [Gammaproteobacteria bacterium]
MLNLLEMPLVLGALAFTGGIVLAKLGSLLFRPAPAEVNKSNPDLDKRLRSMEADLRVTRKKLEQADTELAELRAERGELRAELDECHDQLNESTSKLTTLKTDFKSECEKTRGLRTELTERAEESIRAQVQIRDMETELSLASTSTVSVQDEIDQLIAEREDLDGRREDLDDRLGLLKQSQDGDSTDDQRTKDHERQTDIVLDC